MILVVSTNRPDIIDPALLRRAEPLAKPYQNQPDLLALSKYKSCLARGVVGVILVVSTNRPGIIDPALLRRAPLSCTSTKPFSTASRKVCSNCQEYPFFTAGALGHHGCQALGTSMHIKHAVALCLRVEEALSPLPGAGGRACSSLVLASTTTGRSSRFPRSFPG